MKQLFFLTTILTCLAFSCRKKNNQKELALPPETQNGSYTFGCKVNGKVFVPRDGRGKPGLFAQYVNLGNGPGGGWYLNIPATNWGPSPPEAIIIQSDSLFVEQGATYKFKLSANNQRIKGSVYAVCDYNGKTYAKLENDNGELHITKHDQQKRILSGTFFFTATNISTGEKISVTDGRFDIVY